MRQKALATRTKRLDGVDTPDSDLHLRTVCRSAALFFDVPIVLVSLVDDTHFHIRASCGVDRSSVPRSDAFCSRTIDVGRGDAVVVRDLLEDDGFRSSSFVAGEPKARFYAGMPIALDDGVNVGTLCLIDTRPRPEFDAHAIDRLRDLTIVVEEHFQLHKALAEKKADRKERRQMAARLESHISEARAVRVAQATAETAASFGQLHLRSVRGPVIWSEGMARVLGRTLPVEGIVELGTHLECHHPDDRQMVRAKIEAVFAEGDPTSNDDHRLRVRIVRSDGDIRNVLIELTPVREGRRRVTSLVGVMIDVTDLARSERQARETSELLRSTLENMDQGLIMLGPDERVRIHNRRVRELLGLPEEILFEGAPFEVIRRLLVKRGEYREAGQKSRTWARQGGIEMVPTCYERRRPNGTDLEIRAVPLSDGGVVRTFTDVTKRKAVERAVQDSERRYRLLAENTTDVIVWAGLDTVRRYVSPAARTVLGYNPEELVGTKPLDFTHPDDADGYAQTLRSLCSGEIANVVRSQRYRRKDGSWVWIEASFSLTLDEAGAITGYVASLRDIDARKAIEDALRDSEERLGLALDGASDGIWDLDVTSGDVHLSGAWLTMLGYAEGEIEPGLAAWRVLTHPDDIDRSETMLIAHIKGEIPVFDCEYRIRTKGGCYIWTLARGRVVARDACGRALRMVGTHVDVTKRKEAELLVAHMARHDPLTDLPNRLLFKDRLEQASAGLPEGKSFAVLACDLDRFKAVNDMLGHAAGDRMLEVIAGRLRAVVRDCDTLARLGGDEFAVITCLEDPIEAASLADRLIETAEEPVELEGRWMTVGMSVGIAIGTGDDPDPDQIFRNADTALYRAKSDGRSTHCFFENGMDAAVAERNRLEHDVKAAMREGGFALHYQPVENIATGRITGFEALMRWAHPSRGSVSPGEFIPFAEESGLIVQLGAWALRQACREAAGWPASVRIAVNVSTMQFRQPGLEAVVVDALARSGLAPNRLELEVTESVLIHDAEGVIAVLHRLRALGIRIALDDFGTGYSSLSYLKRFPFDKIKIDRSFIREIDDPGTAAIVRAVVGLGVRAGADVTAEGVETEEQFYLVRAEGCTEVQGFLFGGAVPAPEVCELLARSWHQSNSLRRRECSSCFDDENVIADFSRSALTGSKRFATRRPTTAENAGRPRVG